MAAEAEAGSTPAKKGPPIMLIAIGAAVVVLLGGGVGAYMMFFSGSASETHTTEETHAEGFIFNLPTMTVNLNSNGGAAQFMKLTIALEVANEEVMTAIQPRIAKVIDAFQVYLRELRASDLEGSAGIYRLKEELRRRINIAIFPQQVDSVLFKEILVQ